MRASDPPEPRIASPTDRRPGRVAVALVGVLAIGCTYDNPHFDDDGGASATEATLASGTAATYGTATTAATATTSSPTTGSTTTTATAGGTSPTTAATTETSAGPTTTGPNACDLLCHTNASCTEMGCACDEGFVGDGSQCDDIDECAQSPCGEAFCVNEPGDYQCVYPQTCAEIKALIPGAVDAFYTLYHKGLADQKWEAFCYGMSLNPREYLQLNAQGPSVNYGRYTSLALKTVTTYYHRVRIDPFSFQVDIGDTSFSTKSGEATFESMDVASVAYGAAVSCNFQPVSANIDLTGTPFEIIGEYCLGGDQGGSLVLNGEEVVNVVVSGGCGWQAAAPGGCPEAPVNGVGGSTLALALK